MRRFTVPSFSLVLVSSLAFVGCGQGEGTPALSIPASTTAAAAPADQQQQRLLGTWNGVFAMHADAALQEFDEATLTACKTMKIRIQFREQGAMAMTASMVLPEMGEKTNTSEGRWELLQATGDTLTVRSTEDGAEPEDITMVFRDANTFEMTPPNQLRALGVMRFSKVN